MKGAEDDFGRIHCQVICTPKHDRMRIWPRLCRRQDLIDQTLKHFCHCISIHAKIVDFMSDALRTQQFTQPCRVWSLFRAPFMVAPGQTVSYTLESRGIGESKMPLNEENQVFSQTRREMNESKALWPYTHILSETFTYQEREFERWGQSLQLPWVGRAGQGRTGSRSVKAPRPF